MTKFHISDTHWGHKNIIAYCHRPFKDFEQMDWVMVSNWNNTVGPTDVVYHHGDVALGSSDRWDEILKSLNGYKVLICGNHDRIFPGEKPRQREKWYEKYHEWFDEVYDNYEGHVLSDGTVVNLSHYPYVGDSHDGDRYAEYRLADTGVPLIHGHVHNVLDPADPLKSRLSFTNRGTRQVHIGVDSWNFAPVPESEVIELLHLEV